jgi:hypothetical protein
MSGNAAYAMFGYALLGANTGGGSWPNETARQQIHEASLIPAVSGGREYTVSYMKRDFRLI